MVLTLGHRSVLSQLTTPETRADVLAWYVTTSTLGSSLGSEASGRIVHYLQSLEGWTPVDSYRKRAPSGPDLHVSFGDCRC